MPHRSSDAGGWLKLRCCRDTPPLLPAYASMELPALLYAAKVATMLGWRSVIANRASLSALTSACMPMPRLAAIGTALRPRLCCVGVACIAAN
jgi:hypothetical protein